MSGTTKRRGLATLEMVLALPMLLFVMALMINFGAAAGWKVRTLCVARNSLWGNRSPRTTSNSQRPAYWPLNGAIGFDHLASQSDLDGPQPAMLGPGGLVVPPKSDILNPTLGMMEGRAGLVQRYPLLQKLGRYSLTGQTELLDNTWEFQRMGLSSNTALRIPTIYSLPPAPNQEVYAVEYKQAALAILAMLTTLAPAIGEPALRVLDREVDFMTYGEIIQLANSRLAPGYPEFHPPHYPLGGCGSGTDLASTLASVTLWVYGANEVNSQPQHPGLIDQIQGGRGMDSVPKYMTNTFIQLYQQTIQAYQNLGRVPPPELQNNINTLTAYLGTL
jgi:hypothetical protein